MIIITICLRNKNHILLRNNCLLKSQTQIELQIADDVSEDEVFTGIQGLNIFRIIQEVGQVDVAGQVESDDGYQIGKSP